VVSERWDRKAAKYGTPAVPHPFDSRATYDRSLRQPLGRDFNTDAAFRCALRACEGVPVPCQELMGSAVTSAMCSLLRVSLLRRACCGCAPHHTEARDQPPACVTVLRPPQASAPASTSRPLHCSRCLAVPGKPGHEERVGPIP